MLFKVAEWQDTISKEWSVGNQDDLAHGSNCWWLPPRFLGIALDDWILKLKNEFNAKISYIKPSKYAPCGILLYHWDKREDAHKYVLWLNKEARKNNWTI